MALETEAKIRLDDHEAVRARLEQSGAQRLGEALETNSYFDTAGENLLKADAGLRLRCVGRKSILSYKGPQQQSRYKQREEIQTTVGDPQAAEDLLGKLGLQRVLLYEKRRESWLLGNCRVELDTVPLLGAFVEVEGPEGEIAQALGKLALVDEELLSKTYPALLRKHLQRTQEANREIRLASGSDKQ